MRVRLPPLAQGMTIKVSKTIDTEFGEVEFILRRSPLDKVLELTVKRGATDYKDQEEVIYMRLTNNQYQEMIETLNEIKQKID